MRKCSRNCRWSHIQFSFRQQISECLSLPCARGIQQKTKWSLASWGIHFVKETDNKYIKELQITPPWTGVRKWRRNRASVAVAKEEAFVQNEVRRQPCKYLRKKLSWQNSSAKALRQVFFIRNCQCGCQINTKYILDFRNEIVKNECCPIIFTGQVSFRILC